MALTVETEDCAGCTVVRLAGDLELSSAAELDRELIAATSADSPPRLVVDLADVQFCDSTGLGVLVRAYKRVKSAQGGFCLSAPSGMVGHLLEITQLGRVLAVYPSAADGCAALSA